MPGSVDAVPLDSIAHVIQVALTPVFLLSGIGALLNVFNTRLARVSDHVSHTADLLAADPQSADAALMRSHIRRLRRRVVAQPPVAGSRSQIANRWRSSRPPSLAVDFPSGMAQGSPAHGAKWLLIAAFCREKQKWQM